MALTPEEVEKVAELAMLELSEEEKKQYQMQLSAVLDYVEMLNELDLEGVLPTGHAIGLRNVFREDLARPSLPLDEVLFNAPRHARNQFLIQAVLDE